MTDDDHLCGSTTSRNMLCFNKREGLLIRILPLLLAHEHLDRRFYFTFLMLHEAYMDPVNSDTDVFSHAGFICFKFNSYCVCYVLSKSIRLDHQ